LIIGCLLATRPPRERPAQPADTQTMINLRRAPARAQRARSSFRAARISRALSGVALAPISPIRQTDDA
jgi:hypothetical protein